MVDTLFPSPTLARCCDFPDSIFKRCARLARTEVVRPHPRAGNHAQARRMNHASRRMIRGKAAATLAPRHVGAVGSNLPSALALKAAYCRFVISHTDSRACTSKSKLQKAEHSWRGAGLSNQLEPCGVERSAPIFRALAARAANLSRSPSCRVPNCSDARLGRRLFPTSEKIIDITRSWTIRSSVSSSIDILPLSIATAMYARSNRSSSSIRTFSQDSAPSAVIGLRWSGDSIRVSSSCAR